jgi:hypothetical protein
VKRWCIPPQENAPFVCAMEDVLAVYRLSVMSRQCLDQRIDTVQLVQQNLDAWLAARGEVKVNWHFTTDDARVKLRKLYPSFL